MSTYYIGSTFLRTRQVGGLYFSQSGVLQPYHSVSIFRRFTTFWACSLRGEWTELSCGIDCSRNEDFLKKDEKGKLRPPIAGESIFIVGLSCMLALRR